MRGIRRRPHHAALCMTKLQKRGRFNITTISVLHSCCIKHATIMTTKTARNNYDEFYFCTFNVLNDSVLHINCTFYRTLLQYFYSYSGMTRLEALSHLETYAFVVCIKPLTYLLSMPIFTVLVSKVIDLVLVSILTIIVSVLVLLSWSCLARPKQFNT